MSEIGIHRSPTFVPLSLGTTGDSAKVESQSQAKISSARLTPLSTPQVYSGSKAELLESAQQKSTGKAVSTCPSRKEVAEKKLDEAADKCKQAQKVGVDVAKSTFFRKMLSVAFSAVAVGIAAGLTALSFGGAGPVLALACASLVNSIGDATCAYRNVKNAQAVAEGREPPYNLPGGNSLMGNIGHAIATKLGASPETAAKVGKALGVVVSGGLAITGVVLSLGLAAAPAGLELASQTSKGLSAVTSLYAGLASASGSGLDEDDVESLTRESAKLVDRAKDTHPDVDVSRVVDQLGNAGEVYKLATEQEGATKDGLKGVGQLGGMVGKLVL
jgi:hypothetical protein